MRINTNITAMNTFTQYTKNNKTIANSVAKLSSGYAINSAADNAAGLAISEKMRAQIRGLEKASTNSQDAISLVQTAEGSLGESTEILQRMRELAVQSSNDTNQNEIDRTALQDEFSQLQSELDDIAKTTSFNKKTLLDGSLAKDTAKLSNVNMAKPGLSVELGNADTGNYSVSVNVKQESAAIEGVASTFTATSNTTAFTVGSVTNNLGASSLANGNYKITASYDTSNDQMIFTAAGDNGQNFTATLSKAELTASFGAATPANATLNFKNGTTTAFSFTVKADAQYTISDTNMETLASNLTDALSLSASKGVDAQDATYGLYASMTGAEDVKLYAGMDSATFSNGVKINFDELTTTDVNTANTAAISNLAITTGSIGTNGTIALSSISIADDAKIDNATTDLTIAAGTGVDDVTITDGQGNTYTATLTADDKAALLVGADPKEITLSFKDAIGKTAVTAKYTVSVGTTAGDTTGALAKGTFAATADVAGAGHKSEETFGTTASTFDVINKEGDGLTFQVGANEGDEMVINIDKMDANYLGVASAKVDTQEGAATAIGAVDKAINQVSAQRAYLGAVQNRLDHKIANLDTSAENLTSAESQIRDVDMAKEMTKFTNANILSQAATAMLAQANSLPQNVLSLIG